MPEIKEKPKGNIKQLDKNVVKLQKLKNNIVTTKEKINEFTGRKGQSAEKRKKISEKYKKLEKAKAKQLDRNFDT